MKDAAAETEMFKLINTTTNIVFRNDKQACSADNDNQVNK